MFGLCADAAVRQEIADMLTQDGAIQQIPTVITPGEPVPKVVREHKGGHANTKLYIIEGLTEAIARGGDGFFELLAKQGGIYNNHGTWCLIWLTDAESRLRVERQSARLFQSAVYNPTFFTTKLIEPNPGNMPAIATPEPSVGDPDGRIAALCAKVRRTGEVADQVELAEELARMGDQLSARELFQHAIKSPDAWRVRAAKGLYKMAALPLDEVGTYAHQVALEERPEAMLLFAQLVEDSGDIKRAEAVFQEALLLSQDPASKLSSSLAKSQFLRRQKRPKEALTLLRQHLPNMQREMQADDAVYAPLWVEAGRNEMEIAFAEDGTDPTERLQSAKKMLEKAKKVALFEEPNDFESAHHADTFLIGLSASLGEETEALTILNEAQKRAEASGYKALVLDAYRTRMGLLFEMGENSGAMAAMNSAVKLAKQIGYPDLEASALRDQAEVESRLGNLHKAKKLETEAETLTQFSN
jgi:tetratricopeptide (TPR) repeat protein